MKHLQKITNNSNDSIFDINPHVFLNEDTKTLLYDRKRTNIKYLKSDGDQYIDTGIIPDANTGIYIGYEDDFSGTYDHYMIGCRTNTNDTRWCIGRSEAAGTYYGYDIFEDGPIDIHSGYASLNYMNDHYFYVYDNLHNCVWNYEIGNLKHSPIYNIRLFGGAGVIAKYTKYPGALYFVKISQGTEIIMDLIPVKVGNVGYMYDKISRRLFRNNGTGSFELGPKIQN